MKVIRVVLAVLFVWSVGKSLELVVRKGSVDRLLFEASGLLWLFWMLMGGLIALQIGALVFVARPALTGTFRLAVGAVMVSLAETVIASLLGFGKPELLKSAIVQSRTERELPVREEVLRLAENPIAQLLPIAISVALSFLWLFLIVRLHRKARAASPNAA